MNKEILDDIVDRCEYIFPELIFCQRCYGYKGFKINGIFIKNSKIAYLLAMGYSPVSNLQKECDCEC